MLDSRGSQMRYSVLAGADRYVFSTMTVLCSSPGRRGPRLAGGGRPCSSGEDWHAQPVPRRTDSIVRARATDQPGASGPFGAQTSDRPRGAGAVTAGSGSLVESTGYRRCGCRHPAGRVCRAADRVPRRAVDRFLRQRLIQCPAGYGAFSPSVWRDCYRQRARRGRRDERRDRTHAHDHHRTRHRASDPEYLHAGECGRHTGSRLGMPRYTKPNAVIAR